MIELPEAQVLARQLAEAYTGACIERVEMLHDPHGFAFVEGDPATYGERMYAKTVRGAAAYGGHIVVEIDDMRLTLNDGVNLRYLAPGDKRPVKHQMLIEFRNDSALSATIQMYGFFGLFDSDADAGGYFNTARKKPSPLSEGFTRAYFQGIVDAAKPTLSVKGLLATEQRVPGLGNGVLQDILFNARINPKRKLNTLSAWEFDALYESVCRTLMEMTAGGGRDVEKDLYGCAGGYVTQLSSKTLRKPCPRCGGVIERQAYMGGNIYFCPTCQPV